MAEGSFGVVIPFPMTRASGTDYNGATMRPEPTPEARLTEPFRIGEWEVRPRVNELVSEHDVRHLEPMVMDLLLFITSNAPEVVSKDAIIDSVWEGRFISEGTLTNTVAELRRLLGDDARQPRYIETISKRGYRVVAEVSWIVVGATAGRDSAEIARDSTSRPPRQFSSLDPNRVLVLPFENRTRDPERDVIGLMTMDWLSQGLSRWAVGDVVPSSTAREMVRPADGRHGHDPVLAAATATNAGVVVWGSYYLDGGSLLIQANVTDTTEERLLWSLDPIAGSADGAVEIIETLREQIAGLVACHFASQSDELGQVNLDMIGSPPPFNAYREFLDGHERILGDMATAIRHFRRAAELAPGFVPAWTNLIVCHLNTGECEAAAAAADEMEAGCAMDREGQQHMRAFIRARLDGQWMAALAALRSGEALVPNDGPTKILVATAALRAGQPRVAVEACSAIRLQGRFVHHPASIVRCRLISSALHILGEHDRELEQIRAVSAVIPNPGAVLPLEIRALAAAGRIEELERVLDRTVSTPAARSLTGRLMLEAAAELRAHGQRPTSIELAERAVRWVEHRPPNPGLESGSSILRDALCAAERWPEARELWKGTTDADDLEVWGTVGWLSARVRDEAQADEAESRLRQAQGPYLYGEPLLQQARIRAHRGQRNRAMELLCDAFASGLPHDFRLHRDLGLEPLWREPRFWETIRP